MALRYQTNGSRANDGFGSKADMVNTSEVISSDRHSDQNTRAPALASARRLAARPPAARVGEHHEAKVRAASEGSLLRPAGAGTQHPHPALPARVRSGILRLTKKDRSREAAILSGVGSAHAGD